MHTCVKIIKLYTLCMWVFCISSILPQTEGGKSYVGEIFFMDSGSHDIFSHSTYEKKFFNIFLLLLLVRPGKNFLGMTFHIVSFFIRV